MRTKSAARDLETARLIRRATTSFAARARAARTGRLSLNQTAVLGIIARTNGITPGEVATQLQMLPQSLTRQFATVEAEGWVKRLPDPSDGRQSLLMITETGLAVLDAEMRPRDEWVAEQLASRLTSAEREILAIAARILDRMGDVQAAPVEP